VNFAHYTALKRDVVARSLLPEAEIDHFLAVQLAENCGAHREWLVAFCEGRTIRVEDARIGARVMDSRGNTTTITGRHGGAVFARTSDGNSTCYAGCADVLPTKGR
jgi:hypothetical protein